MGKPLSIDEKTLEAKRWRIKRDVVIDRDMMYAPVYHSLSRTDLFVLHRFLQKRSWNKKTKKYLPHEKLTFSYLEAKALGISGASFKRSIRRLVERGFLIVDHQGGALGSKGDCSVYMLSDEWRYYGTGSFKKPSKRPCLHSGGLDKYNARRKGWVKTYHPDSPLCVCEEGLGVMVKSDHAGGSDLTMRSPLEASEGVQI